MTNLDSVFKSWDITLLTKVHIVKAMVLPVFVYEPESWTVKKAEHQRIDAFKLQCWKRLLSVFWTARWSNQSVLKEINLNIYLKDWCWSWSSNTLAIWYEELTCWKRPWCWERLKANGKGAAEDKLIRQHHSLNGHEFEQTLGENAGYRSLACYSPWGHKESDMI